jgi:CHAT domain-containing protein
MFQFVITSNRFKSHERTLPENFERLAKGLMNGIYFRDFNAFAKCADGLKSVLTPQTNKPNVTVIPSGRMSTLPLEVLPVGKMGASFETTKYLVSKHAISSEFSVGLIAQKSKSQMTAQQSIFLCAPVRFPGKDNLDELPGTESEIKAIADLFPSATKQVLLYADANEGKIKTNDINKYNYLHFATHGVVDETEPELSRIFLNDGTGDDGHLFAGEIYNLNLNADLAVLSACQTGLGKYSKGEGVIGLSRALVYAGARNLVVSFWSVADQSTSQLMTDFYATLLKNQDKGFRYALQQSKLKMIGSKNFSDPYFWAPFVLIGF